MLLSLLLFNPKPRPGSIPTPSVWLFRPPPGYHSSGWWDTGYTRAIMHCTEVFEMRQAWYIPGGKRMNNVCHTAMLFCDEGELVLGCGLVC